MKLINNIPGPVLVFMGACCLSFGGLIVKSFEGSTLWQILFWRSVFFTLTVLLFLVITYKKNLFEAFYKSGLPGFFGGIILSFGFSGYVFAMYNTTVANTNFIISTQILFLAVFGYVFLKEKISLITLTSIILAIAGVILMLGASLSPGEMSGNLAAFSMPITFAILIMIVRKFPTVDMVPSQFIAGVCSCFIGFMLSEKLMISSHDIIMGFIAGFFQVGLGFIFITIGAKNTPSATVGVLMLSESILGPTWAFFFIQERPNFFTLIGGGIILFAVILQFYNLRDKSNTEINEN
jgi:drug/metabolite transporter (DMT)-like permease